MGLGGDYYYYYRYLVLLLLTTTYYYLAHLRSNLLPPSCLKVAMRPSENRVFSTVMRHASHRNGSGSSSNHMIGVRWGAGGVVGVGGFTFKKT